MMSFHSPSPGLCAVGIAQDGKGVLAGSSRRVIPTSHSTQFSEYIFERNDGIPLQLARLGKRASDQLLSVDPLIESHLVVA